MTLWYLLWRIINLFKRILLDLDKLLAKDDIDKFSLIEDRLNKINESYFSELVISQKSLQRTHKKSILRLLRRGRG